MYPRHIMLSLCIAAAINLYGQEPTDSTDIFYGHIGEATVTGVTGRTQQKQSPVPIQVVGVKELRQVSTANIVDAIANQPGVSQLTTGGGISKPVIRGLGSNRIVCIADGIRQEGQQWGDEHGLELDGAGVSQVEIIKGPASLMYGSDAMAGVVIFQPGRLLPDGEMKGSAEAEYQTNNGLWRYSLGHSGNKNGFVWDAHWSQQAAHAYKNKRDGYVPGTQHRSHAARAMIGLDKFWGHSLLTFSLYSLTPSIPEGERDEMTGALEQPEGWSKKTYGMSLPFQRVNHYKVVSDNAFNLGAGTLAAVLGYQHNRRREYEEDRKQYGLGLWQHTFTFDLRYTLPFGDGWKVSGGMASMVQHSANKGEEYLIPDYTVRDVGFFVTASRAIEKFDFSGGVRFDRRWTESDALEEDGVLRFQKLDRKFSGVTGSLGVVWHPYPGLNLRLNAARGFRAPSLPELASNGVHEGTLRYETGNADLDAEHSWQGDFGADYSNKYLSAQVSFFANRISNYIFTQRTGEVKDDNPEYRYTSGTARLMGFEAALDVHPIHSLHLQNTFSYINAVQLHQPKESKYLPHTPPAHWRSEVKWEITHRRPAANFGITNAYVSGSVDVYFRQNHVLLADNTETPTPSYTLVNLNAGTDIIVHDRKAAEIHLGVENIFDRAYQPHLSRLKYADGPGLCNMGRNFTIKMIIPF